MAEADIYINTADEEAYKPDTLALSKLLVDVNDSYGAYAFVNKTYKVILHEIGHAVGLDHIPVKRKRHQQGLRGWWTRSMVSSNSTRIIQSFGSKAGQQVC